MSVVVIYNGACPQGVGVRDFGIAYLGEGTVVPEVALVGEAVADEAKLALLDVLLDGVKELLLGDLMVKGEKNTSAVSSKE